MARRPSARPAGPLVVSPSKGLPSLPSGRARVASEKPLGRGQICLAGRRRPPAGALLTGTERFGHGDRDRPPPWVYAGVMEYRRVGRSGLRVSAISLGGWITFGGSLDDGTTRRIVGAALERGVNFIDLADAYARGGAERTVGRILSDLDRSKLVLSSKLFWPMSDDPNDRGLSRKHIMESVERSLRNLGTEYLDIYFCHREDPDTPLEETARAMDDLVRQGKILYWGTSVWGAARLRETARLCREAGFVAPIVEQPPYSLLERGIEAEVLPAAGELGMGLTVWSPLAGGMLTGKYDRGVPAGSRGATTRWLAAYLEEPVLERVRAFTKLAQGLGCEPSQLALAWILRRPQVSCVLTGATGPEQLEQNLAALEVQIPDPVLSAVEELFPPPPAAT